MENDDGDHVSKSRKVEKRRLHKQRKCANVNAKLESYEDLEARMEHMESRVKGHFDEDPGHAMTRAEWEAIYSARLSEEGRRYTRAPPSQEESGRRASGEGQDARRTGDAAANNGRSSRCEPNRRCFRGFGRRNGGSITRYVFTSGSF